MSTIEELQQAEARLINDRVNLNATHAAGEISRQRWLRYRRAIDNNLARIRQELDKPKIAAWRKERDAEYGQLMMF